MTKQIDPMIEAMCRAACEAYGETPDGYYADDDVRAMTAAALAMRNYMLEHWPTEEMLEAANEWLIEVPFPSPDYRKMLRAAPWPDGSDNDTEGQGNG